MLHAPVANWRLRLAGADVPDLILPSGVSAAQAGEVLELPELHERQAINAQDPWSSVIRVVAQQTHPWISNILEAWLVGLIKWISLHRPFCNDKVFLARQGARICWANVHTRRQNGSLLYRKNILEATMCAARQRSLIGLTWSSKKQKSVSRSPCGCAM